MSARLQVGEWCRRRTGVTHLIETSTEIVVVSRPGDRLEQRCLHCQRERRVKAARMVAVVRAQLSPAEKDEMLRAAMAAWQRRIRGQISSNS